jgi:hypothetical protein
VPICGFWNEDIQGIQEHDPFGDDAGAAHARVVFVTHEVEYTGFHPINVGCKRLQNAYTASKTMKRSRGAPDKHETASGTNARGGPMRNSR